MIISFLKILFCKAADFNSLAAAFPTCAWLLIVFVFLLLSCLLIDFVFLLLSYGGKQALQLQIQTPFDLRREEQDATSARSRDNSSEKHVVTLHAHLFIKLF